MKLKYSKALACLSVALLFTGCSSVWDEEPETQKESTPRVGCESQQMPLNQVGLPLQSVVQSNPSDAFVLVNDVCIGKTPLSGLQLNQFDRVELYKPGFAPMNFTLAGNTLPSCIFNLQPTNTRLFNLLANANVRFVYRPEGLRIEPANLPVFANAAFVIFDPNQGKDVTLAVGKIASNYVVLNSGAGESFTYPITRVAPANPPAVPNVQPTNSPYQNCMYGNAAQNPQAPVMQNFQFRTPVGVQSPMYSGAPTSQSNMTPNMPYQPMPYQPYAH